MGPSRTATPAIHNACTIKRRQLTKANQTGQARKGKHIWNKHVCVSLTTTRAFGVQHVGTSAHEGFISQNICGARCVSQSPPLFITHMRMFTKTVTHQHNTPLLCHSTQWVVSEYFIQSNIPSGQPFKVLKNPRLNDLLPSCHSMGETDLWPLCVRSKNRISIKEIKMKYEKAFSLTIAIWSM